MAFHEKAGRSQVGSSVFSLNKVCFSRRVATVAMLPSALSRSDSYRSVHVGRSRYSRCCHLIGALWFCSSEWNRGQAINAVTETRLWAFCCSLPGTVLTLFCLLVLCGCRHGRPVAVVQRFIHFSAHPQMMQQHRQLSSCRNNGSLLPVPSTAFRQLQAPTLEITVDAERS